ncbi:unnamed protein product [Blepharisma stoltei]|uniref:PH domain-containing protein n=1 Tax=Blepharisma stoltei TaxID=1481888 RepID=A0AAU9IMG7_9CILI|nr:unnamed protein product [Blepharisma stoltei]
MSTELISSSSNSQNPSQPISPTQSLYVAKLPLFLTREDIIKKVKELKDTISKCKKERITSFLQSKHLKHFVCERVDMLFSNKFKELKDLRRESTMRDSPQIADFAADLNSNPEIASESSFTDSNDSLQTENSDIFPKNPLSIQLEISSTNPEIGEARAELQALEEEFIEKQKASLIKRQKTTINPTEEQLIEHKTSYRSYVKFASSAYSDEAIIYSRKYVVIDYEELNAFYSAKEIEPMFSLTLDHVVEIIDQDNGDIKVVYKYEEMERAVVIFPLTAGDYKIWKAVCKNIAGLKEIVLVNNGALPERIDSPDLSPALPVMRKHRKTHFFTLGEMAVQEPDISNIMEGSEEQEVSQEISQLSEEIDVSKSTVSWDYDFDALDEEQKQETPKESDKESVISITESEALEMNIHDERHRTYTILASLGKTEGLVNLLTKGGIFLKYGRHGKPHLKHVVLTADLRYIEWRNLNKIKPSGSMAAVSIRSIQKGRNSPCFNRFKHPEKEELSFSLISNDRSLDLELVKENIVPRDVWVEAFQQLINQRYRRDQVQRYISKRNSVMDN